ncbi:CBS domain-containing protein [Streptomyces sp. NPDC058195]|uniref:CBS domain-containing protein n=1 Tax=Streptomyces sp. NPDC058195 TaxID=3346375 RepID=UPI0036F0C6CC
MSRAVPAALDTAGPQVRHSMTAEVPPSGMASPRTGHPRICDNDGLHTGLVPQIQLTTVRDSPASTDRLQLRDIPGDRGPHTSPAVMPTEHATHHRRFATPSAVNEQDSAPGVPALVL